MQSSLSGRSGRDEQNPEDVRRAIRRRSEALKRREVERAVNNLRARGELTEPPREVIEEMADAIVDGVLAVPDSMLKQAAASDENAVETALELFDPSQ